jgi:hypothetical protein
MVARGIAGWNELLGIAMGRLMKIFHLIHRSLDAIGKIIGQLVVLVIAISLFIAPLAALVTGSLFAAAEVSNLIGGGIWLTLSLFWVFVGLIGFYAGSHALPQISAAIGELLKSN